jgi:hypothetical protein
MRQWHIFLIKALGGGEWATSRSGRCTPSAHCKEGTVGPRSGLYAVVKEKICWKERKTSNHVTTCDRRCAVIVNKGLEPASYIFHFRLCTSKQERARLDERPLSSWPCHDAMTQAVSSGPLTAETRVRARVSPCGMYGGKSVLGQVYLRVLRFPLSISFHRCLHTHI